MDLATVCDAEVTAVIDADTDLYEIRSSVFDYLLISLNYTQGAISILRYHYCSSSIIYSLYPYLKTLIIYAQPTHLKQQRY